jgi:hypothetical protein
MIYLITEFTPYRRLLNTPMRLKKPMLLYHHLVKFNIPYIILYAFIPFISLNEGMFTLIK